MQHRFVSGLLLALGLFCAFSPARGAAGHHVLWEVKGRHNTVYLLGSVHMLKPSESTLPPEAMSAYSQAKTLVMELDLSDPGVGEALLGETSMAMLPENESLQGELGADLYGRFAKQAA